MYISLSLPHTLPANVYVKMSAISTSVDITAPPTSLTHVHESVHVCSELLYRDCEVEFSVFRWPAFQMEIQKLCSGDWERTLQFSVWDWNKLVITQS